MKRVNKEFEPCEQCYGCNVLGPRFCDEQPKTGRHCCLSGRRADFDEFCDDCVMYHNQMLNRNCRDVREWRVVVALSKRECNKYAPIAGLSKNVALLIERMLWDSGSDGVERYRFGDTYRLPCLPHRSICASCGEWHRKVTTFTGEFDCPDGDVDNVIVCRRCTFQLEGTSPITILGRQFYVEYTNGDDEWY